jgi:hypothetical protein
MIPNILNTLLGISLVYCAILAPGPLHETAWLLMAGGVGTMVLALWARRGDRLKWFNFVNATLGAALILLGVTRAMTPVHPLVMFWWVFWVGIIVAVLGLWSAIYTREISATGSHNPR